MRAARADLTAASGSRCAGETSSACTDNGSAWQRAVQPIFVRVELEALKITRVVTASAQSTGGLATIRHPALWIKLWINCDLACGRLDQGWAANRFLERLLSSRPAPAECMSTDRIRLPGLVPVTRCHPRAEAKRAIDARRLERMQLHRLAAIRPAPATYPAIWPTLNSERWGEHRSEPCYCRGARRQRPKPLVPPEVGGHIFEQQGVNGRCATAVATGGRKRQSRHRQRSRP